MFPFDGRSFVDEVRPADADALVAIHSDAFARPWATEDFAALMAETNVFALALRQESVFGRRRLAGFVLVRVAADEAEILTIAVRPDRRGRGFGRMLMEEALRRLYRERIAACFLEVDRDNAAAVRLYEKLGFAAVGERKGYYRRPGAADGTALVMRLQLR
jgi:ribosomal-protein-alanine N-acetyltransferase